MASQCSLHVQQVPPTQWVLFRLGSVLGSTAARKFRTLKMTDSMFSKSSLCGQYPVFWVAEIERRSSNVVKAPMGFFVFGSSVSVLQKPRDTVECPVKRSEGSGEKFVDTTFDPNADENFVPRFQKILRSWTDATCCYVVEILHCVVDYISFWLSSVPYFVDSQRVTDHLILTLMDGALVLVCFCFPLHIFAYFPWFHWLCILLQHLCWGLETECWTRKEWNNKTRKQNQKKWSTKWKVPATHGDSCDSCDMLLPGICDTSRWCMWTRRSQAMTAQPASQETVGCEQRRRGSQGSH